MRKLVLLIVLWLTVAWYFPDSRLWVKEMTSPVWVPIVRWNAREEMRQVARDVVDYEVLSGKLPDRRKWLDWLDFRYPTEDLMKDPWGSIYQLQVWADSVGILSYGADRTRNTSDDFRVTQPRRRSKR